MKVARSFASWRMARLGDGMVGGLELKPSTAAGGAGPRKAFSVGSSAERPAGVAVEAFDLVGEHDRDRRLFRGGRFLNEPDQTPFAAVADERPGQKRHHLLALFAEIP